MADTTRFEAFLGRDARAGSWEELARGTYRVILDALGAGSWQVAEELLPVTILEAEELHDIYGVWPGQIADFLLAEGADAGAVENGRRRLWAAIGDGSEPDWEGAWQRYVELTSVATSLAAARDDGTRDAVLQAHETWRSAHDQAVDHVYGMVDLCFRLLGEGSVPRVWDHLMSPWYDDHATRLSTANQPWSESARQLKLAIVDGFHAHLSGTDRLGDVELLTEPGRTGFRFAPCGSGGRVLRDDTTGGRPRVEEPFAFSVTTEPHDWSFGEVGVCTYCVHCCLLNMTMPIDRLGYPTRVIEPPTWPDAREGGTCTWWVYDDPSLVPDSVYERVGRVPDRRPSPKEEQP